LILSHGRHQRRESSQERDGLEHDLGLAGIVGLA
jgi:hypothetical protein